MFMQLMSWERGNAALYPRFYTSLRGLPYRKGPFSHHLSVSEAVTLHINGPNGPDDWHQALSIFLSPPLTLILYLCILFFFFPSLLMALCPPSRIFSLSCFQHFGPAVHKSLVISLWHTPAPLRQPVVWFSLKLIFVPSDTLYVSASVSRTQFGRSEFSSQRSTFYSLFMRENGIKSVHYRLQFFWPGILFSLAAALKVCWNRPFFHVYKWAPFMNPWGNACFLKQFKRILHRTQSGALDLRSVFTHSIILRLI